MNTINFRQFFRGYVECALWSSGDYMDPDDGDSYTSFDELFGVYEGDIPLNTYLKLARVCKQFIELADDELDTINYNNPVYSNSELAGHDLWLTQNGHGAGFWDRGLGELGDILTEKAKSMGSINLYIGDDGMLYCS